MFGVQKSEVYVEAVHQSDVWQGARSTDRRNYQAADLETLSSRYRRYSVARLVGHPLFITAITVAITAIAAITVAITVL